MAAIKKLLYGKKIKKMQEENTAKLKAKAVEGSRSNITESKPKGVPSSNPEGAQTVEEVADANRDRALRAEQYATRKKKRRRGRSLLMFKDEQGVSDTLG